MPNDVTNLPALPFDIAKMAAALTQPSRDTGSRGAFLRMNKQGEWCFGVEAEEIAEDQTFLVNPGGFQHGFVCWAEAGSEKLGEVVSPRSDPIAPPDTVPVGGRGWEFELGCHLKGYKGSLDGIEMVYRSSSVGGKRALDTLSQLIGARMQAYLMDRKANDFLPVVTLSSDSYKHKKFGKIFTPEITITKWLPMPGTEVVKPVVKPEALKKGKR